MKYLTMILILIMLALPVQAFAQTTPYDNPDSPVDLLASYYNAINLHDYQRAYGYWGSPTESYNEFASGFAETVSAQLIVQPPDRIGLAAGSQYAAIPTVLIATHTDGSVHTFAGCFTTRKSNLIPEEDVWHLYTADLVEVSNTASIPTLLAEACPVG